MRWVRGMIMAALFTGLSVSVQAAEEIPACRTQRQLEQLLRDDGRILPEGCRRFQVTTVETTAGRLCAIDTASQDPGIIGSIREATTDTQWWTPCASFGTGPR